MADLLNAKTAAKTDVADPPETTENTDQILVEISHDRMEAKIKFVANGDKTDNIPVLKIKKALEDAKVRFGIMDDIILSLSEHKAYDVFYQVAVGKPPVNGENGYLKLNFENSSKTYKPKITESGKADYHDLDLVKTVVAGQLLMTAIPPVPGEDGMNVLGQVVAAKHGRPAPALPRGKNVVPSKNNTELHATANGQIIYDGGSKISISSILEIPGNIDNSTGNVNFNGAVVIKGSVFSGFSVIADGNIEIMGVVEAAHIKSNSHVFLYSGVKGGEKALIQAAGDITVKYAENCTMEAGRNVIASCILFSNITSGGYVEVSGRNGSLVGGKIKVATKIDAISIGSSMSAPTEIELGSMIDDYRSVMNDFEQFRSEYIKIDKLVGTLTELNKTGSLDKAKKDMLFKSVRTKLVLRQQLDETQKKLDTLMPLLTAQGGLIIAREVIYSGVKVIIGNSIMHIRDDIRRCTLKNVDGKIVIDKI